MRYILLLLLFANTLFSHAQHYAFQRRDLYVSGALSLGNFRHVKYEDSERAGKPLPVYLSTEYGLNNVLSLGPYVGYYSRLYRYMRAYDLVYKAHYTSFGVRGSLHFSPWLEKKFDAEMQSKDLDLYTSAFFGYTVNSFSKTSGLEIDPQSGIAWGLVLGARYFLNYRAAIFGEVGPGVFGMGSVGITFRF